MSKFEPRTTGQVRRMFGLGKPLGCGLEELQELAFDVTKGRTSHLSELSFDEANGIIKRLGGQPFRSVSSQSRRTVNYHRQQAGVDQLVTTEHIKKMESLWFKKPERTAEGLTTLCMRILVVRDPATGEVMRRQEKPRTTKECNKVIEAIKSMNKRDNVFSIGSQKKEVA